MSSLQSVANMTNQQLLGKQLYVDGGIFDAGVLLAKGAAVAQITSTGQNTKQSITATSVSSGSAVFSLLGYLFTIPYNSTAAQLKTNLEAKLGQGSVVVTGTDLTAGALVVEFVGPYKNLTVALATIGTSTAVGGSFAVSTSQVAIPEGRYVPWNGTKITDPTAVLSVSATGSGGTFAATAHAVSHTWSTAEGETLASPATTVTLTSGQNIRVAAINAAGTPDDATAINVYVDGLLAKTIAVSTPGSGGNVAQTDIPGFDTAIARRPLPSVNTALVGLYGAAKLAGFTNGPVSTDPKGNAVPANTPNAAILGSVESEGSIIRGGIIKQSAIVGVADFNELIRQKNAQVLSGSVGAGTAVLAIAPLGTSRG